jgi:hypothetical protein
VKVDMKREREKEREREEWGINAFVRNKLIHVFI